MELTGKIHRIEEEEHISDRFFKQDFILDISRFNVETGERWENHAQFQVTNGRVPVNHFAIGQKVKVSFYIAGRFYDRKDGLGQGFFQNLVCTGIEPLESVQRESAKKEMTNAELQTTTVEEESDNGDLPF